MLTRSACEDALERARDQYLGFYRAYAGSGGVPRSVERGVANVVTPRDWTSGFVAGTFWYLFESAGDRALRAAAEHWTDALEAQRRETGTHDVGFMLNSSFGHAQRLAPSERSAAVLVDGAAALATRFRPAVGATRSWDFGSWSFPVIVDNMMNLELLFRAAELGAGARFAEMAVRHARTTLRDHYRADASSYHVVDYDPATGAVLAKETRQGLHDESVWARGQAWGLYGFTMSYREAREPEFLNHALRVADFLLDDPRIPGDRVPYFDFDAPATEGVPALRDASAAAITASALLELAALTDAERSARYLAEALAILESLSSPAYAARTGENGYFLLRHSVGDFPRGTELDAALNYADYYYVEALTRARSRLT